MNHSSQRFNSAEEFEDARALKPGGTALVKVQGIHGEFSQEKPIIILMKTLDIYIYNYN